MKSLEELKKEISEISNLSDEDFNEKLKDVSSEDLDNFAKETDKILEMLKNISK